MEQDGKQGRPAVGLGEAALASHQADRLRCYREALAQHPADAEIVIELRHPQMEGWEASKPIPVHVLRATAAALLLHYGFSVRIQNMPAGQSPTPRRSGRLGSS